MISLADGIIIAISAFAFSVFLGFLTRLVLFEKITSPLFVAVSTFLFLIQIIILSLMPIASLVVALTDKDVSQSTGIKKLFVRSAVILISPFLGFKYIIVEAPRYYNEFFKALRSIIAGINEGINYKNAKSDISDFLKLQFRALCSR